MEYVMSMYRNKDDMISDMRAEITKLRADLAAERELSDRLAEVVDYVIDNRGDCYIPSYDGSWDDAASIAITAHATRMNK